MLTVVCASNRSGVTNWFRSIVGRHKDGGGSEPVPVPRTDRLPKLQLRLHHAANRTGPLQLPDAGWGHLCESLINFSVQLHKPVWVLVWREMRFVFFPCFVLSVYFCPLNLIVKVLPYFVLSLTLLCQYHYFLPLSSLFPLSFLFLCHVFLLLSPSK